MLSGVQYHPQAKLFEVQNIDKISSYQEKNIFSCIRSNDGER